MSASVAPGRSKGSWGRVLALIAFLAVPLIPQMRVIFPIEQTLMLLVALTASCMIVGWRQGGKLSLALIWLLLALGLIVWPAAPPDAEYGSLQRMWVFSGMSGYNSLARGWTLLLAASFGLVSLFGPGQAFISRALATLGLAAGLGFAIVFLFPGGPKRIGSTMTQEFARRNDESINQLRVGAATEPWKDQVDKSPAIRRLNDMTEEQLLDIPKWSSRLVAAVLGLESLAAMALAWSLYHRLSSVRIGPMLGRLRDFRFNDQLVWGVAVGASVYLVPAFSEAKGAGLNILAFFGSLYVLRGLGILGWISKGRIGRLTMAIVGSFIFVVVIADILGFLVSPVLPIAALAFTLGLGDTWVDWRTLLQPKAV